METKKQDSLDFLIKLPSGKEAYFVTTITPIVDNGGKVIKLLGAVQDITERKKMEESMHLTQMIVDNSQDGIVAGTPEGIITSWNRGAEKMYGYTAQEIVGKSAAILFPPENKKNMQVLIGKIKRSESISGLEIDGIRKDGARVEVSVSASPILSEDKKVISVSVVIRDISKLKKVEQELLKLSKAVYASNEAIYMTDHEGMITFVNPGFTILYGYRDIEVISKTTPRILKSGLTKLPEYQDFWKKILSKQKVKVERTNKRRDGQLVSVEGSVNPIIDDNGNISGFLAIQHDVTERKKSEQHIKELNEVRNKFIEIISHQLRTPLTAINWNLESLLNGDFGKMEATQEKFLQVTYIASVNVASRIHDLLTAMDIEEGRVTLVKEDIALDSICSVVIGEMARKCKFKNISLTYTPPEGNFPVIEGDGEKIRVVVTKLVENAIAYTKEGGQISAKLLVRGPNACFEISDSGIGIPKSEQKHIFNRFFRASNSSVMLTDAFGLGLFISRSFIDQHKGKIGFVSIEGKGSTFWFEIPLKS